MALSLALRDGKAKALGIRLLLFGAEYVGKTCVADTLVDDPFQECRATQGADIQVCNASNWKKVTKKELNERLQSEYLRNLKISAKEMTATATTTASAEKEPQPFLNKMQKKSSSSTDFKLPLPEVKAEDIKAVKGVKSKGFARVIKIKGGIDVTILDFAGQVQYHNTHSVFIRKDNVIMVVFNASLPLSAKVKARPGTSKENPMTNSQNIHFWMKTVHSICQEPGGPTDKASLLPVIILVATHLDLLGDSAEETKEQIIQTLARELKGRPYARHLAGHGEGLLNALRKYCIFLSNKVRDPKAVHQLQSAILEVSDPILSKEYPLVYLKIERELLSIDKGVITIEEFHSITYKCGFLASIDSKEFAYALEDFHHQGKLLNFASIESLKGLVILSPHWLTKLFSYALIAHPYKPTGNGLDFAFDNLKENGILLESFLSFMLDSFNNSVSTGCPIKQIATVDLMKRFGFLAEISPKTKILEEDVKIITQEKSLYIVPSLLPDDKNNQKRVPEGNDENVRVVYYHFPEEFVPPMLFNQVVAMCINRNEDKHEELIWYVICSCLSFILSFTYCTYVYHRLRKGKAKMVLGLGQCYCVSLCEELHSIQLSFVISGKDHSADQRFELFQYIQSKIELLMDDFMPASTKPRVYVPCYFNCRKLHLELEHRRNKESQYCSIEDKHIPADYYLDLFPDKGLYHIDKFCLSQL